MPKPTTTCDDCGDVILASTARRTRNKCTPCSERIHTHLDQDAQRRFTDFFDKLKLTGWKHSLPHLRDWLDLQERLRVTMMRSPDSPYRSLTEYELTIRACADLRWRSGTIDNLSRMTFRVFAPVNVLCNENEISFDLNDRTYLIHFGRSPEVQRIYFLSVVNNSLAQAQILQRFILLPSTRPLDAHLSTQKYNPLAFVEPSCIRKAVDLGIIPDTTGMLTRQVEG